MLIFLLSIPILNEGISLAKLIAVGFSLGGIMMIFFSPNQNSGKKMIKTLHNHYNDYIIQRNNNPSLSLLPPSPSGSVDVTWYGYLLAIISVFLYALEEVFYKLLYNTVEKIKELVFFFFLFKFLFIFLYFLTPPTVPTQIHNNKEMVLSIHSCILLFFLVVVVFVIYFFVFLVFLSGIMQVCVSYVLCCVYTFSCVVVEI